MSFVFCVSESGTEEVNLARRLAEIRHAAWRGERRVEGNRKVSLALHLLLDDRTRRTRVHVKPLLTQQPIAGNSTHRMQSKAGQWLYIPYSYNRPKHVRWKMRHTLLFAALASRPLARQPRVPPAPIRRDSRRATPSQQHSSDAASAAAPAAAYSSMRIIQHFCTQRSNKLQPAC